MSGGHKKQCTNGSWSTNSEECECYRYTHTPSHPVIRYPLGGTNHICGDFFCSQKLVRRKCGNFFSWRLIFHDFGTLSWPFIGKHSASATDFLSRPQRCPPPNTLLLYVVPVRGLLVFRASSTQQIPISFNSHQSLSPSS
jgi:hypothetical protein